MLAQPVAATAVAKHGSYTLMLEQVSRQCGANLDVLNSLEDQRPTVPQPVTLRVGNAAEESISLLEEG